MSDTSIEARIAALEGRIADLERQQWEGPPRLGPRPPTREEVAKQTERFIEQVRLKIETTKDPLGNVPPVDRSKVCTTSGEPAEKVRAEQTNETGQHKAYIVLCDEERRKGFVRPFRDAYKHTQCGTVTTMGRALSETYARDPSFYGSTFCVRCNAHYPVGHFTWTADGAVVGS